MKYLLAKFYVLLARLWPHDPRAVNWLDTAHEMHDRAGPYHDPEGWRDDA